MTVAIVIEYGKSLTQLMQDYQNAGNSVQCSTPMKTNQDQDKLILSMYIAESITVSLQEFSASLAFINYIYTHNCFVYSCQRPTRQKHLAMKMLRRKLLSDSAATGVQQQSTIYIQDVSIRRSFSTGIQLT